VKPYYQKGGITIYCGDCLRILPSLHGVDFLLTDPPYGMNNDANYFERFSGGNTRRGHGSRHKNIQGDDKPFDPAPFLNFSECIIWGVNHFWNRLPAGGCLCWLKRNDGAFGSFLSDAEIAFVKNRKGVYCHRHVFAGSQKGMEGIGGVYSASAHPNQKPVSLMKWCLSFAPKSQLVLDPFMGSGTTLVAAKMMDRRAIGIEIEEKYCRIAVQRLTMCRSMRHKADSGFQPLFDL
jgi:site-specific DNA-methyltransferase (adenine-specific)